MELSRVAAACALLASQPAAARGQDAPAGEADLIDGPPAPVAPAVMTRDAAGGATVRAMRVSEAIRLDGVLDEPIYATAAPITGLIQHVPDIGAPATEKTDAWILFDETNVYVSARVWDSAPESQWVANEMRRDTSQLRQNDTFLVLFDTFYDRRNGVVFYTNPLGARADQQLTNEGNPNADWNPVWDVRTGRFDGGWTVEMEIPFKTLRYRSEPPHVWGIQLRRATSSSTTPTSSRFAWMRRRRPVTVGRDRESPFSPAVRAGHSVGGRPGAGDASTWT